VRRAICLLGLPFSPNREISGPHRDRYLRLHDAAPSPYIRTKDLFAIFFAPVSTLRLPLCFFTDILSRPASA